MKLTVGLPKMGIRIKDLNLDSMEVTKRGVELAFYEDGKHAGDLIIKPTPNSSGIKETLRDMAYGSIGRVSSS